MSPYGNTRTGLHTLPTLDAWCQSTEGCVASWWRASELSSSAQTRLVMQDGDKFPLGQKGITCLMPDTPVSPCPANGSVAPLDELYVDSISEFGNEVVHGLPYLSWLSACGLLRETAAGHGMAPFYTPFSREHKTLSQQTGVKTKFSWGGASSLRVLRPSPLHDGIWYGSKTEIRGDGKRRMFFEIAGQPSPRWLPPPLHATYRAQPLAALNRTASSRGRVFVSNSDPLKFSLEQLNAIFTTLLGCGLQVVYTGSDFLHPARLTVDLEWADQRFPAELAAGRLVLLARMQAPSVDSSPQSPWGDSRQMLAMRTAAASSDDEPPAPSSSSWGRRFQKVPIQPHMQKVPMPPHMQKVPRGLLPGPKRGKVRRPGSKHDPGRSVGARGDSEDTATLLRDLRQAVLREEITEERALRIRVSMRAPLRDLPSSAHTAQTSRSRPQAEREAADWTAPSAQAAERNVLLLRAAARARCFVGPRGGSSYVGFYQPGLHVVSDERGRERCWPSVCAEARRRGRTSPSEPCGGGSWKTQQHRFGKGVGGSYFQFFARLPGTSGDSVIVNTGEDPEKLAAALRLMCTSAACEFAQQKYK